MAKVTRHNRSDLSVVYGQTVTGVLPPLTQTEWYRAYLGYKFSGLKQKNSKEVSLDAFKKMYYLEYFYQTLGRLLGIALLVPLLFFLLMRKMPGSFVPQLVFILILGGLQGILGWYLAQSGLIDNPRIGRFRLTANMVLSMTIYSYMFWLALDLLYQGRQRFGRKSSRKDAITLRYFSIAVTTLIGLMIFSGSMVTGSHGGLAYNTFPMMDGEWLPQALFVFSPLWHNLLDNPATIQFVHRLLAFLLLIVIPIYWWYSRRLALNTRSRRANHGLIIVFGLALISGVVSLLYRVPLSLAVAHQIGALMLFTAALYINHALNHDNHSGPATGSSASQ